MFWDLLVAQASFRKPYLNMLREATVAHAPRAHFDPCRSEGLFFSSWRLSELWKPCPARCLETRLLPVSHPAVASGDRVSSLRLEFDLECFRTPVEEKHRKLAMEIKLLHPSRHTLCALLPLMLKHQGVTWKLSVCLTDAEASLGDPVSYCAHFMLNTWDTAGWFGCICFAVAVFGGEKRALKHFVLFCSNNLLIPHVLAVREVTHTQCSHVSCTFKSLSPLVTCLPRLNINTTCLEMSHRDACRKKESLC